MTKFNLVSSFARENGQFDWDEEEQGRILGGCRTICNGRHNSFFKYLFVAQFFFFGTILMTFVPHHYHHHASHYHDFLGHDSIDDDKLLNLLPIGGQ